MCALSVYDMVNIFFYCETTSQKFVVESVLLELKVQKKSDLKSDFCRTVNITDLYCMYSCYAIQYCDNTELIEI